MRSSARNYHIGPMFQQIRIFPGSDFRFNDNSAYFRRNWGQQSLAQEWKDMWYGCSTGQCDGNELDVLWCAWIFPEVNRWTSQN